MPRFLVHGFTTPPTNEQRALALALTSTDLENVRDLVRKLDLPASVFGDVLQLYHSHLGTQIHMAEQQREEARQKKINAILLGDRANEPMTGAFVRAVRGQRTREIGGGAVDIYNLDDEDLDKLYREATATVGSGG